MKRIAALAALTLLCLGLAAPTASARKPVISYRDASNMLRLYDAETGQDVAAPAIEIPGLLPRYSMSLDGRYVVWADDASPKKIHLFDRGPGAEVALPGIDIYGNPGNLTVSNTGRIAFDDNSNGPTVVYDSGSGSFVPTGLDANNSHRQTRLSGDGRFLATTCVPGTCEAGQGSDSSAYVQDLTTQTDTGFPDNLAGDEDKDEEHPCIDGDGSLVGVDIPAPVQRDIFLYDRSAGSLVTLPGVNDPVTDDVFCVLDAAGDYLGYTDDFAGDATFRVYERATSSFLTLPTDRAFDRFSVFSAPFPPPDDATPPPSAKCAGVTATLVGSAGRNVLRGTPGRDVIAALGGNDKIRGRGGRDLICAGSGKDRASGGGGADRILGGAGADLLDGGAGRDRLFGGRGRDHLFGGAAADLLRAGPGRDRCAGGAGRDSQRGCER